ncbi:hypothetical protein A4G28_08280 [Mycobacterium ostraviense]|uniref:Antitoxin HicB n=2 Tax=Mycobacterium ostraviense TaxID=2738409 RepID=A0A164AJX5_9MYCO|nr:hypothetical protein A4G28_08280 [Mycobacterium ostraviense]
MVAMTTYTAIASRGEKYWLVRVLGLGAYPDEGLPTQARTLSDVEPWAHDLIATYLDIPADSFDVEVKVELPDSVRYHLDLAAKLRKEAADAQAAAAQEYRRAALELKNTGLTVRDIGAALGVSHQRVHQLVSDHQTAESGTQVTMFHH